MSHMKDKTTMHKQWFLWCIHAGYSTSTSSKRQNKRRFCYTQCRWLLSQVSFHLQETNPCNSIVQKDHCTWNCDVAQEPANACSMFQNPLLRACPCYSLLLKLCDPIRRHAPTVTLRISTLGAAACRSRSNI